MSIPTIDFEEKIKEIRQVLKQKLRTASEIGSKIAYLSTWRQWLNRIKDKRDEAAIPTRDLDALIKEMSKQESELERVYNSVEKQERLDRLLTLAKPIFPFLSLDCDEQLKARVNFPCGHVNIVDLFRLNETNERDYRMWLSSLEQLLSGQLKGSLGFGVACSKCGKTSLSVRLFIDPQKIVDLARQGKISVR